MLAPTKRKAILSLINDMQQDNETLSFTDCLNELVINRVVTIREANYILEWLF